MTAESNLLRASIVRRVRFRAFLAIFFATSTFSHGARVAAATPAPLTIDLGQTASETEQTLPTGTYQVTLTDLIIGKTYQVKTALSTKTVQMPAPLTAPSSSPPPGAAAAPPPALSPQACTQAIADAEGAIAAMKNESQVRDLLDKNSPTGIPRQLSSACAPADAPGALAKVIADTTRPLEAFTIANNQTYTVSISRVDTGTKTAFGPFTFNGPVPSAGQWLTYYGFNFVHSGDEQFFSKQNAGTPTTYTITQQANRGSTAFTPSVYFTWVPGEDKSWYPGWVGANSFIVPVAGLGFDFSNPVVFLGYGVGWGYNVMVDFGVAAHKEERLLGQYNPGQIVTSNLTEAQLTQQVYKPQWYIGVSFRFGSNPFQSSAPAKAPAKPASTP